MAFARRAYEEHSIAVERYILMPDHVHLFVSDHDFNLGNWIGMLKQSLAKAGNIQGRVWQEGFFDHLLRNSESYSQKWEYVRNNPIRAGFVGDGSEWPWQGELIEIKME